MGVRIAELAGGLLQLAIAGAVLVLAAELASQIFFKIRNRIEKSGE